MRLNVILDFFGFISFAGVGADLLQIQLAGFIPPY